MFFIEYAKEIMYLCFGIGFLGVSVYLMRALYLLIRLAKKVDDLVDLFIHYIQKPLSIMVQIYQTLSRVKNWFSKK